MEKDMEKMAQQLAMATNGNTPTREEIESDVFDRPPIPNVLRLSTKRFINKSAIGEAVRDWLVDVCEIEQTSWKITGRDSGKDFLINFVGPPLVGARLVNKAMGNLKDDNDVYRKFTAKRMDGAEETFRVDRDENGKSRTQRRMSACLRKVIEEKLPDLEQLHIRKDFKKGKNTIFLGKDGLCTMRPKSPIISRDAFLWDLGTIAKFEIDRDALIDAVMPMFERPEDTIEWSL
jgi:hypothetical protein